ncbi:MAG: hypothetical protein AAF889_07005 [Cyanobacteria bacterium P01_D01_bin.73]
MRIRAIASWFASWFARFGALSRGRLIPGLAALCLGMAACGATEKTQPQIPVWEDTQNQLDDLLIPVDYGALVNRSLAGDRDALVQLIKLADQTNGGGAYGFGTLLKDIAFKIGDEQFAAACRELSGDERKLTFFMMEAGFEYGDRELSPDDLPQRLPLTAKVLNPNGDL